MCCRRCVYRFQDRKFWPTRSLEIITTQRKNTHCQYLFDPRRISDIRGIAILCYNQVFLLHLRLQTHGISLMSSFQSSLRSYCHKSIPFLTKLYHNSQFSPVLHRLIQRLGHEALQGGRLENASHFLKPLHQVSGCLPCCRLAALFWCLEEQTYYLCQTLHYDEISFQVQINSVFIQGD
jgi:hypothetical protein